MRRPPPGVGVVRRALQHSRPGSRRGEAARSPLLLFLHRVAARARLCRYVLGGAPRAANVVKARPCGGGGVGPRRSGARGTEEAGRVGRWRGPAWRNRAGTQGRFSFRAAAPGRAELEVVRVAGGWLAATRAACERGRHGARGGRRGWVGGLGWGSPRVSRGAWPG